MHCKKSILIILVFIIISCCILSSMVYMKNLYKHYYKNENVIDFEYIPNGYTKTDTKVVKVMFFFLMYYSTEYKDQKGNIITVKNIHDDTYDTFQYKNNESDYIEGNCENMSTSDMYDRTEYRTLSNGKYKICQTFNLNDSNMYYFISVDEKYLVDIITNIENNLIYF